MLELLIFFFKQKTAYELRISDWSSDVCSSDLNIWKPTDFTGQAGDFPWGPYFDAAGVAGQAEYLVGQTSAFSGEAKAFAAAPLAVIKDYEIGRASCRERVCQYVSITVDAVIFKKKKHMNTNRTNTYTHY